MRFEPDSTPPCFISEDQSIKIQKDDDIRLKVVGTNFENQNIYGIGTIKGDYLGSISLLKFLLRSILPK
jgi:DNA-directed RNA polymerase II subunit RPB7